MKEIQLFKSHVNIAYTGSTLQQSSTETKNALEILLITTQISAEISEANIFKAIVSIFSCVYSVLVP